MFFIIFAVIIAVSCSALTIRTLVGYSDFPFYVKAIVTLIVAFSWFAPILSTTMKRALPNISGVVTTSQILYMLFGFAFILLVIILSRDIVWYILYFAKKFNVPSPKDVSWINRTNAYALTLSFLIFAYALFEGMKIPAIKEVNISSSKVSQPFTIALVTDIHINLDSSSEKIRKIVEKINEQNVDVVLFAGDMVDGMVSILNDKFDILKGLNPKYGVYFSSGNHELYSGLHNWKIKINNMGDKIKFIDNQTINLSDKNVSISAIPDARVLRVFPETEPDLDEMMKDTSKDAYRVLMSHAPNMVNGLPEGMFDLQVSGHTHGGQIFPFHIFAKLENKFLAGLYDVRGTKLYVSRGTGYWGPPLRFLAPSEITLIRIIPENE